MKWYQKHTGLITETISYLFILLFVFTGATKLMEGDRFFNNLNNSPIIPGKAIAIVLSWAVPLLEIAVAALIAWPATRLKGLYGALALMAFFTLYVAGIVFFSPYVPCSCGGVITLLSWPQHLVLNTVLILLAITGIRLYGKKKLAFP
ncbi:MauE/DoxX family redox-associated membrane protein [Galbibacter sp. PAP.153]|uniref:MauE/DoxX family redox-associated membrane protein n=1 Tax=Galbibacter sp. PAP.153 TaxID=3104623 RepID=UPI00300A847D